MLTIIIGLFKLRRLEKQKTLLRSKMWGLIATMKQLDYKIPSNSTAFDLLKLNQAIALNEYKIQELLVGSRVVKPEATGAKEMVNTDTVLSA